MRNKSDLFWDIMLKIYKAGFVSVYGSKVNRRTLYAYIGIVILILIAIATYIAYRGVFPSVSEKVVVYAYRDAITGIDPSIEDDTGIIVLHLIYETLLRYDPVKGEYVYVLAEDVRYVNDTKWRIILRNEAKFHDGAPVTAYDVEFSIMRTKRLYEEYGRGTGYIWECVKDINVIDEKTLDIETYYPCDIRPSLAGAYGAFVYSRNVLNLSKINDMLSEDLIIWFNMGNTLGSGPYRLVEYRPENQVILEKFKDWWGWRYIDNPNVPDKIYIKIIEDPGEQERLLKTGHIDIASSIPRISLKNLGKEGFTIKAINTFHNFILMYNTRKCPTNIREVRKAITYAIPWDKIVDKVLMGYGKKGSGLIPYGFLGYSSEWGLQQDIDKARELLKDIDIPCELKITIVITQDYEEEELFATLLKEELSKIGIILDIEALPWEQVKNKGQSVWHNPEQAPHLIINDWWPTYIIPYDYFALLECLEPEKGIINTWNWSGYCNNNFDDLLAYAYETSLKNLEESLPLYKEIQKIVYEDMPAINLWDMQHIYVYRPDEIILRNEAFNPLYTFVIFFQYVEVKK